MSQSPFAETAPAMIAGGYSPVPIAPAGDHDWSPEGKEPGRLDHRSDGEVEWVRLRGWQVFRERQAHPRTVAYWSSWPDAGIGLACGFGGVVAVDIDDEALVEPLLAVLPRIMVAKRGRKGLTAFYRAAWGPPSKNYKTADKRGLLDFLAAGKQTVLPPTIHPETRKKYEWIDERTLLNTPLSDLPVLTREHHAEMEEVLRAHGWGGPKPSKPRNEAVERPARPQGDFPSDDEFDATVTAARAQWLPLLGLHRLQRVSGGWRAVASFRQSGTGQPLDKRGQSLAIRDDGPIIDHGTGQGYNDATLVEAGLGLATTAEAFAWLRKTVGLPAPAAAPAAPAVEPTYPDRRVSLVEAETTLVSLAGDFFDNSIRDEHAARNQRWLKPPLIIPNPPVKVARVEAGIGKTRIASEKVAEQARRGRRIAYVVQRLKLADEAAVQFAAHGVTAEAYRGYDQDDPLALGHKMCRNLPAYQAALALGVSIRSAVCERRIDGEVIRCPFANVCGRERQREARPQVWIVTAAMLFLPRPAFVFDGPDAGNAGGTPLDAVVIDERFHDHAIGEPQVVDVAALLNSKIEACDDEEADFLTGLRHRLHAAVKANGDGTLSRAVLGREDHQILIHAALRASQLEQRRVSPKVLRPDMPEPELKTVAHRHAAQNQLARDAGALWEQIALFLAFDQPQSGRIMVAGSKVTVTPLRWVHPSWRAPTLVLDATAPPSAVLSTTLFGDEVTGWLAAPVEVIEISARWPNHVRVRQIKGAPASMGKVGLVSWAGEKPNNVRDILQFIRLRAASVAPAMIGVVTFKGLLEKICDQLPSNVITLYFGALSGTNIMENVCGLIVIGRPAAQRDAIEAAASVFADRQIDGGDGHRFPLSPGGIRLAAGGVVETVAERHPDPMAEAMRCQVTEDDLLQAAGRLRPHRRTEPCWMDLLFDVPLPIIVHDVVQWNDVKPGAEGDMAAEGVILTNVRDAMAAFGLSDWEARGCVGISNSSIRDSNTTSPARPFRYRKAGPGQKVNEGTYLPGVLPGGMPALRVWLEERLGRLSHLEVERVRARNTARGSAMLEKIGRDTANQFERVNEFPKAMHAIAVFFDGLAARDDTPEA